MTNSVILLKASLLLINDLILRKDDELRRSGMPVDSRDKALREHYDVKRQIESRLSEYVDSLLPPKD